MATLPTWRGRFAVGLLVSLALGASTAPQAAAAGLYVSNSAGASVSVFTPGASGALSPVTCDPTTSCKTGTTPIGVAIDPTASHVYVANFGAGSMSVFAIGAGGALTPVTCNPATDCKTGSGPNTVAIDPSGTHLYVTNNGGPSVSVFSIVAGGALSPVTCNPATDCKTGGSPRGVAIDTSGKHLYVANSADQSISVFSIGATGALTPVTCNPATDCKTGTGPLELAIDPSGTHLYVANDATPGSVSVFAIGTTGALTPVTCDPATSCKAGDGTDGIAIDASGTHVYTANMSTNSVSVFAIGAGGALSPVTCDPATSCRTGAVPTAITVGSHVYTANFSGSSVSVFAIGAGGALSPVTCDPATICKTGSDPNEASLALTPDPGPFAAFSPVPRPAGSATSFDAGGSFGTEYPIATYVWSFGDGQSRTTSSPATTHTYAQAGQYAVKLAVTDQAGCSTAFVFTGRTASCRGTPGASVTHAVTVPAAPAPVVPPLPAGVSRISNLAITPSTIFAASRGPSVVAARAKPGAIVSYVGSQAATTAFKVQRPAAGRVKGRACVKPTKRNRSRRRCTRWLNVGGFSHADSAGANRFRFTGRVRGRKLRPGRYRLRAVPHNAAGAGPAAVKRFRVKPHA